MINCKPGDVLLRVVPPVDGRHGYSQAGKVETVTDDTIVLAVQADIVRRMSFNRTDGTDSKGHGSFIVRQDLAP